MEVAFLGTLARAAEAKVSKNGKPYLRFTARVGDGDKPQWVSVTAFDPEAIAAVDKMIAGARVYVEGRLSLDEWTAADGGKRTGLSVVSWHCRPSEIGRNRPKRDQQKREDPPASGRERAARSDFAPAGGVAGLNDQIPFAAEFR